MLALNQLDFPVDDVCIQEAISIKEPSGPQNTFLRGIFKGIHFYSYYSISIDGIPSNDFIFYFLSE